MFKKINSRQEQELDSFSPEALRVSLRKLSWKFLATERNKLNLVNTIKSVTEVLVWGDQHNPEIFAVFLEEQGLRRLLKLIQKKCNRRGPIAVQVLQTLAMLVQNIRNKTSLFQLLTAEAIREVINLELDFNDEEVLCYYVSFLKSVTMGLDHYNIGLFVPKVRRSEERSMPLFTKAAELLNCQESMVRKAMRTVTLTILSMKDERINKFLVGQGNRGFYSTLVKEAAQKSKNSTKSTNDSCEVQEMRTLVCKDEEREKKSAEISHLADDITDTIDYMNEIFSCASVEVQLQMANAVWDIMLDDRLTSALFKILNQQFTVLAKMESKREDDIGLLKLPRIEELKNIVQDWLPKGVDLSIFSSFLLQTLNVIIRSSGFKCNRVLVQAINDAFYRLNKTEIERRRSLLKLDLDAQLFDTASDWQLEVARDSLMQDPGLLAYAEVLGLDDCLRVLKKLFQTTRIEKYKPCPLLVKLSRYPKSLLRRRRMSLPVMLK